jgi:hypothetical protein
MISKKLDFIINVLHFTLMYVEFMLTASYIVFVQNIQNTLIHQIMYGVSLNESRGLEGLRFLFLVLNLEKINSSISNSFLKKAS